MRPALTGRGPTVARSARVDLGSRREIDKPVSKIDTMPQILCWKCRKLTRFGLERCQHCGSAFAGSTGGAYGSGRVARAHAFSPGEEPPPPSKRSLVEIFDDLQHVRDVAASGLGRPREREVSRRLYQCPTCGRFVSEQATECMCGVRFAPAPLVTFMCPECESRIPSEEDACPVCGVEFEPSSARDDYVYACPRCGAHVASDALRCPCGAWFED